MSNPVSDRIVYNLHHIYPQEFFDLFLQAGIKVDDFVMRMTAEEHIGRGGVHLQGQYNPKWRDFFADAQSRGARVTRAQCEEFLAELLNDLGLANRAIGSMLSGKMKTPPVPKPRSVVAKDLLDTAEKEIKAAKKSARGKISQRGVGQVGFLIFCVAAVGTVLYAIKEGASVKAMGGLLAQTAVDVAFDSLVSGASVSLSGGPAAVGWIVGMVLQMKSDQNPEVQRRIEEQAMKEQIASEFLRKNMPSAGKVSSDGQWYVTDDGALKDAVQLLFGTEPIQMVFSIDLDPPAPPTPRPAAGVTPPSRPPPLQRPTQH
jgi:hypothetical protein